MVMAGAPPLGREGLIHGPGAPRGSPQSESGVKDAAPSRGSWGGRRGSLTSLTSAPRRKGLGPISGDGVAPTALPALMPFRSLLARPRALCGRAATLSAARPQATPRGCGRGALVRCKVRPRRPPPFLGELQEAAPLGSAAYREVTGHHLLINQCLPVGTESGR